MCSSWRRGQGRRAFHTTMKLAIEATKAASTTTSSDVEPPRDNVVTAISPEPAMSTAVTISINNKSICRVLLIAAALLGHYAWYP